MSDAAMVIQNVVPATAVSRADELNAIAAHLFAKNQMEAARIHALAALSLEPNHADALQNLGAILRQLRHYVAAETVARKSVKLTGGKNPFARNNLGISQLANRKYDEALETLKGVTVALPDKSHSWHNYGLALYQVGSYQEALDSFDKSLVLQAKVPAVESDRALTLLSLGQISAGLKAYEVRWKILFRNFIWNLNIPEWQGESLKDCRILVHHEQGFGDSIMLVRFIKLLAQKECHITLAVPQSLVKLFQVSFPSINVIDIDDREDIRNSHFDYHIPLLSLMRWIRIKEAKDISHEPYLRAKPIPAAKLPATKFHVGICWASGNHSRELIDRRRLVPLTLFLPLLEQDGVSLVSLQKGEDSKDISTHGLEGLVFDLAPKLETFSDTANTIACLDLVITVDSAVAHLAGAVGCPCLMLSPFTRCWRWWGEKSGWPWYNRMRLYYQDNTGSWAPAMEQVAKQVQWMLK